MTPAEIAEAFCTHRFDATFEHLADDISWNMVGGEDLKGKQAVIERCELTTKELGGVSAVVLKKRTITDKKTVVVETLTRYTVDSEASASLVASCDVFDFEETMVAHITSYVLEVEPPGR